MGPGAGMESSLTAVIHYSTLTIVLFAMPTKGGHAAEETRVLFLEKHALQQRRKLASGICEIDSNVTYAENSPHQNRRVRVTAYLDGKRRRIDYLLGPESDAQAVQPYRQAISLTDEMLFQYTDKKMNDGSHLISYLAKPTAARRKHAEIPDFRLVGFCTTTFANLLHHSLNSFVGSRRNVESIELNDPEIENGIEVECITYHRSDGKVRVWIAPGRQFNITRIDADGGDVRETIEVSVSESEGYGWFPSVVKYERWEDGKNVKTEMLRLTLKSANQNLSSSLFTPAGMNIPVGTRVYDQRERRPQALVFDGKSLVSATPHTSPAALRDDEPSSTRTYLLVANGIIFAAMAVWLTWRSVRKRRNILREGH